MYNNVQEVRDRLNYIKESYKIEKFITENYNELGLEENDIENVTENYTLAYECALVQQLMEGMYFEDELLREAYEAALMEGIKDTKVFQKVKSARDSFVKWLKREGHEKEAEEVEKKPGKIKQMREKLSNWAKEHPKMALAIVSLGGVAAVTAYNNSQQQQQMLANNMAMDMHQQSVDWHMNAHQQSMNMHNMMNGGMF
jgi:hypothetical protein